MKLKLKSILAAALCAVGLAAFAEPKKIGDSDVTWELTENDTVLTIAGTGAMPDLELGTPWDDACWTITTVKIESGVASVGAGAFKGFNWLRSVSFPSTLTRIGAMAFLSCSSLQSVSLPPALTIIDGNAFDSCGNLESITIPESVTNIGYMAFQSCSSLQSASLPSALTKIDRRMFCYCRNLESITIPSGVTQIGSSAFSDCEALACVSIKAKEPPELEDPDAFSGTSEELKIGVPFGTADAYKGTANWSDESIKDKIVEAYVVDAQPTEHGTVTVSKDFFFAVDYMEPTETVTVTAKADEGYVLASLVWNDGTDHDITADKRFTMPLKNVKLTAVFALQPISYLDWDDVNKKMTNAVCTAYEVVKAETATFAAGKTYVVTNNVSTTAGITVEGTAASPTRLILCDGTKLTAKGAVNKAGLTVTNGCALVICGQKAGTGKLDAKGGSSDIDNGAAGIGGDNGGAAGTVTINGGTVTATGGATGAGIGGGRGAGGTVAINGGTVTATGGSAGAGIGGGNGGAAGTVTINGGAVTATGGQWGAGIGGGSARSGGTVTINGGTVTATGGYPAAGIGAGSGGLSDGTVTFGGTGFSVVTGKTSKVTAPIAQDDYAADHSATYAQIKAPVPGTKGNPWKIGKTADDTVAAYIDEDGKLVIAGAGAMKAFKLGGPEAGRILPPWMGMDISEVEIGEDVTSIGANAFNGSTALTDVTLKATQPPVVGMNAFKDCDALKTINVPLWSKGAYLHADVWRDLADKIVEPEKPMIWAQDHRIAADKQVGVCSWTWHGSISNALEQTAADGRYNGMQLALAPWLGIDNTGTYFGDQEGPEVWEFIKERVADGSLNVMSTMINFPKEDYETLTSITNTQGYMYGVAEKWADAEEQWKTNLYFTAEAARLSKELGVDTLSTEAGFIIVNETLMFDRMKAVCMTCAVHGVQLLIESGPQNSLQLTNLLINLEKEGYTNVGINFDPGDTELFGSENPVDSFKIMKPWIRMIHVKDCQANDRTQKGWNEDCVWGDGVVSQMDFNDNKADPRHFLEQLAAEGYMGSILYERLSGDETLTDKRKEEITLAMDRIFGALPQPIAAESDEFAVDLRTSVEFEEGKTRIDVVTWSATAWGAVPGSKYTDLGYENKTTGATGVIAEGLVGENLDDCPLPEKDGEYVLKHTTGDLTSFVTFVVSGTGAKVGSISNPWMVGGKPGDTVAAYVTDDGELVIGGKGEMGDQYVENPPWGKGVTSLTIGRDVKSIPDYAFFGYTELSNVTFATGALLESIGSHAFAACPNMEELEIPANVTNCGPAVIAGTPNVTVSADNETFVIVDGVLCDVKSNKVISGLDAADVTIPEGMVEIGECAFSTNGALTSVTIPATMMAIGKDAFKGCANLTNVFVRATEPPTLVRYAFADCNDGLKIYVPEGKAEAYKEAEGWSDYASKISDMKGAGTKTNPWTVGTGVYAYIENGTLHVEGFGAMMDFTITNAPWAASAKDIKSIEIAKGVTKIGNAAFIGCSITSPGTFTVDDEEFELNLLAFVTADKASTNAPATGVFRVVKSETGKAETVAAFYSEESLAFYDTIPWALSKGEDSLQLMTLEDVKDGFREDFIETAGEKPYSTAMQDLLGQALQELDEAKSIYEIAAVTGKYIEPLEKQAEKDKTYEIAGTDITWRVMDGVLVIEGEGEMPDFIEPAFTNGAPWDTYKGDISNAMVAAGIESLGAAAFAKCPTGKDKAVFFADPAEIDLAAFVSGDGSVTNDFAVEQILVPGADGGVTNAVKFLAGTDSKAPRYDSIAEAIAAGEVTKVTACSLDGLKEVAETWIAAEAGPQPWTENVEAAITEAVKKIDAATTEEAIRQAGADGIAAVKAAKSEDDLGGTIPGSDVTWKLVGGQLVLDGSGAMPGLTKETAPWSNSVEKVDTVVAGKGVTGLSKGLFTSELTKPADTVIFGSKTATVPRSAFVSADGSINDEVSVLFGEDGLYEAPSAWTDAAGNVYESYAEAFEAGVSAVTPSFATSEKVEEKIEKAPAAIIEKVQPIDESGRFIWDGNGDLIDVVAVVENVSTDGAETSERIVASAVKGLDKVAQLAAAESVGCTVVTLTVDAQSVDPSDLAQERMTSGMPYGEGFEAKFAEIVLATNDVPVSEAKALIEIHIPYVTVGRENFAVTRLHDGKIEMFTEIFDTADKADATFMVGNGEVVIWTLQFSPYAIGSTKQSEDPLAEQKADAVAAIEAAAGEKPWSDAMTAIVEEGKKAVNAATTSEAVAAAKAAALEAVREQYAKEHGGFLLYPDGDGAFKPAEKSTAIHYGTLIGTNGVEGTITVKMTKPSKKGQFNLTADVKTLVDKQKYSFKAKKITVADAVTNVNGVLTFVLEGSSKKAKEHLLAVTLGGDSLTGAFDGLLIDGARYVFSKKNDPKCDAVLPFVGTWTGAFEGETGIVAFSAKLSKNGSATVKVVFSDGKSASCSTKAEVGADNIVAVPVTVWRSANGATESLGFRLVFGADEDGNAACTAVDLTPIRDWVKKTGGATVVEDLEFLAAGPQTMTAKEFKSYAVVVDPVLTEALGPVTESSLKLTDSTGLISGSLKWKISYVDAKGREKSKTVTGKAKGVVVNGIGIGTVTVKLDGVTSAYEFCAYPPDMDPPPDHGIVVPGPVRIVPVR